MYEIREAVDSDREQVVSLLVEVFKGIGSFEEDWVHSWKNYWNKPDYGEFAFVATKDNEVVADLAFFMNDGHNCIRGGNLRIGGVWAVGTAEEHRRKGIFRDMYSQAFASMNEKGIVLSILEPSAYQGAQIAYEKMGYAIAERRVKHKFLPLAVKKGNISSNISVREIENPKEASIIMELQSSMTRYGSRLYAPPFFFVNSIKNGDFFIFERDENPVGCVKITTDKSDSESITKILYPYFISDDVLPSMLSFISGKSSEDSQIEWICDSQIPIRLHSNNIKIHQTEITGLMMMRVVNFAEYCKSITIPNRNDTEITIELTDVQCPWNEGIYELVTSGAELVVEKDNTSGKADITLNPHQLSMIAGGISSPIELRKYGLIPCSQEIAVKLDAIFPKDSFMSYFRF